MSYYLTAKIAKRFVAKATQRENAKCAKALTKMSLCSLRGSTSRRLALCSSRLFSFFVTVFQTLFDFYERYPLYFKKD